MLNINDKYFEMSKRIEGIEGISFTLNERMHKSEKDQGSIILSVEKVTDQLSVIFQKLKNNDEKIKEIEEIVSPIKLVKSHWKLIMWIIFASSSMGFAFEGGVKNIFTFFNKYQVSQIAQNVIRNERNGG